MFEWKKVATIDLGAIIQKIYCKRIFFLKKTLKSLKERERYCLSTFKARSFPEARTIQEAKEREARQTPLDFLEL